MYEMLTVRPLSGERVAPTTVNKSLPAEVDPMAMKDYELAVTLAADLRAVAAILEVRAETADKSRPVPARRARRSNAPWIMATIAALALAAGAGGWFVLR